MLVTEEDAATKWCPFTRAPHEVSNCIGSNCMAWRIDSNNAGYCGLAGSPQVYHIHIDSYESE